MAKSLQQQLLEAGALKKDRAAKLKKSKHKEGKQRLRGAAAPDEIKLSAQQARDEKARRDRELSRQQQAEREHKAITAQIRQLVERHRINPGDAETPYHFTAGGVVRNIRISAEQQRWLANGHIAIARLDDDHVLIPAPVARRISERDAAAIVVWNSDGERTPSVDEDDPYKDYPIPDDLSW